MAELNWQQLDKKEEKLKEAQKRNLDLIFRAFDKLGFDVQRYYEVEDGWMGGFSKYEFVVTDRREKPLYEGTEYKFQGNDDNSRIFEVCQSGGKALYKELEKLGLNPERVL